MLPPLGGVLHPERATGVLVDREELKALLHAGGFEAFGAGNHDAVYAFDLEGNFVDANDVVFARLGYSRSEMEDRAFGIVVAEDDRQRARSHFTKAVSGSLESWRASAMTATGVEIRVSVSNFPFYSEGRVVAVVGIVRDLGQLEKVEQRANEVEHRLEATLNSMTDIVMFVDYDWKITFANAHAAQLMAPSFPSLIGRVFWETFPTSQASDFGKSFVRAMAERTTVRHKGIVESAGVWISTSAYPTPTGIAIYARDIDAEERAREMLAAASKQALTQAALLDAASDAMVVRRLDGTITYWNRAASELYSWSAEDAIGSSSRDLLFDDPSEYDRALAATLEDGFWFGTVHQHSKEGRRLLLDARWTLVRTPDGVPDTVFSVSSDVTVQRRAEVERLRTQRLESLGYLAGGIAHDLNNVLTPILLSTQLLRSLHRDEASTELVDAVERSAQRGAGLIRQVLTFARGESGDKELLDVPSLLDDLERFCRETLPRTIEISFDISRDPLLVVGDATQLTQVLINLVVNARDAMPNGGALRVVSYVARDPSAPDASSVAIEVGDTGVGMDDQTLESLFEPFFTTKARGSGTGLGLATSLSIVQHHGGTMVASSDVGAGSTIRIELPLAAAAAPAQTVKSSDNRPVVVTAPGKGELILVVDDEVEIRHINCQALEAAGYTTISAEDGAAGIAAFAARKNDVAFVLTDLTMPVMSGIEMATGLRALGYSGPILATSGGMLSSHQELAALGTRFLAKPYTSHELITLVAKVASGG